MCTVDVLDLTWVRNRVVQDLTAAKAKKSAIASAEAAVAALKNRVLGDDLGASCRCIRVSTA